MSTKGKAESFVEMRGSLKIPDMITGKSAYEIAVMHGFQGTEEEWIKHVTAEADRSEAEANRAETEADRAKSEADRAMESDPTVPAWAKKPNPPTPAEIGAIAMFTTSKRLELPGWYRVGTLSMGVLHTAAVRLIIGGQFNHSAHRTQIVDISVDYVEGYITKAVDTVNASNVTKVRLYRLNATDVAIDIYYATTGGNNVRVYVEQLFGSFATSPLDDVTSLSGTILAELDLSECANPPMQLGVEYRTTERWQGYPVYVKCFNIGRVESGTTTIEHGISIRLALETKLYANADTEITLSNLVTNLNTQRTQTNIVTTSAFGSCELFLKYTKL